VKEPAMMEPPRVKRECAESGMSPEMPAVPDLFGGVGSLDCGTHARRCAEHRCVSAVREQCTGREDNCRGSEIDEKEFSHRGLLDRGILPGTQVTIERVRASRENTNLRVHGSWNTRNLMKIRLHQIAVVD